MLAATLNAVRAFEKLGWLQPADWVNVGLTLLLAGVEDDDVLSLAILDAKPSGRDTDGPARNLFERYSVAEPNASEATATAASILATDLRARPARVSSPMIRMLAKLAGPTYESEMANQALGAEEYLDCDCCARVDESFESELEGLTGTGLPDALVQVLAARLRSTLPTEQPPHSH